MAPPGGTSIPPPRNREQIQVPLIKAHDIPCLNLIVHKLLITSQWYPMGDNFLLVCQSTKGEFDKIMAQLSVDESLAYQQIIGISLLLEQQTKFTISRDERARLGQTTQI